jgi:hypothetical protein
MSSRHRLLSLRHGRRRLYRWRRAAGLSIIALVTWWMKREPPRSRWSLPPGQRPDGAVRPG